MDNIGLPKVFELFRDIRQAKCLNYNDDIVIIVSGDEGSGKSTLSLALAQQIDPNFTANQIYYQWKDYIAAQIVALQNQIKDLPEELVNQYKDHYELTNEDLNAQHTNLGPGSVLVYDEAGTQLHSRSSMSKGNIDQVKLFISNRFLRFVHILNVPKPGSLDRYVRHERVKYFIWVDRKYLDNMTKQKRVAYMWSKQAYMRIYESQYWWQLFNDLGKLCKVAPPNFRCLLPNIPNSDYLDNSLVEQYDTNKALFNLKQMKEMTEGKKKEPKQNNSIDKFVKPEEDMNKWCKRTGLSPSSYQRYRNLSPTTSDINIT